MEINSNDYNWKIMYKIGMIAIFITVFIMVAEIFLTMLPDGSRSDNGPGDIYSWFALFDRNWFMAMRNLGLINIFATTLTIPAFFSLFGLHYNRNNVLAGMTLILFQNLAPGADDHIVHGNILAGRFQSLFYYHAI